MKAYRFKRGRNTVIFIANTLEDAARTYREMFGHEAHSVKVITGTVVSVP